MLQQRPATDLHADGATYRARPKTADLTTGHKEKRCALGKALLSKDPWKIIFTDESLFDCADTERCQWVVKGGKPEPRITAKWTARAHVWGEEARVFRYRLNST